MSDFKTILGFRNQSLASDPSPLLEGQIFYNTATNVAKITILETITTNAWASGGNVNTARYGLAGAGTQTAALIFGGTTFPGAVAQSATEKYDGTNWTSVNPLNTARGTSDGNIGGAGTQTSALVFTGSSPGTPGVSSTTEKYDGTNWTTVNSMNTARGRIGGCGTQTAALAFGGVPPTSPQVTEKYDGTNWTTVNSMNIGRSYFAGVGTQTAALAFAGNPPTQSTSAEKYDGTNWTTVNSLSTPRRGLGGAGAQTAALAFGGSPPGSNPTYLGTTELYDGTNWTSNPTGLATGRRGTGSVGTQSLALAATGLNTGTQTAVTEEWTGSITQLATKTITTS
jgi:hypothetical protein